MSHDFLEAVANSDYIKVKELLKDGVNVNFYFLEEKENGIKRFGRRVPNIPVYISPYPKHVGETGLSIAITNKDIKMIRLLLKNGASISKCQYYRDVDNYNAYSAWEVVINDNYNNYGGDD